MGKTSSKVKDRYNQKAYDEIKVRVPKGFKEAVTVAAKACGESVNGYINTLLRRDMTEKGFEFGKNGFDPVDEQNLNDED